MVRRLSLLCCALAVQAVWADGSLLAQDAWTRAQADPDGGLPGQVVAQGVVLGAEISRYLTPVVQVSDKAGGQLLINCVLPRSKSFSLSDYKTGERVQVSGSYYGFLGNAVVLKNCRADRIR